MTLLLCFITLVPTELELFPAFLLNFWMLLQLTADYSVKSPELAEGDQGARGHVLGAGGYE